MKDEQLIAYLAGFFDGEGTISLTRRIEKRPDRSPGTCSYQLIISASQTTKEPLELFQHRFGGSIYHLKWKKAARVFFSWQLTSDETKIEFLNSVSPFLIVKKREAELGLAYIYGKLKSKWHNKTPQELESLRYDRERIWSEMKGIKKSRTILGVLDKLESNKT